MYVGVCAFKDGVQELIKYDTVGATCEDGNAGSCGGKRFRLHLLQSCPGVIWQCFLEILDNPSDWRAGYENENLTTSC